MPFERFEKIESSCNMKRLSLLMISKGAITFYMAFCKEFIPHEFTHVNLYSDKEANKIGFEFIGQEKCTPSSRKLTSHTNYYTPLRISCRGFLDYVEYNTLEKTYFKPQKENDLITIDLNNPIKLEDL